MISFEYFLVLAEEGSVSRAAKKLRISQPGLSAYLKRLEDAYGMQLFTRTPDFALTPAGKVVAEHGKKITTVYKQLEEKCAQLANTQAEQTDAAFPSFTIGISRPLESSYQKFVSLHHLTQTFPTCQFSIVEGSYGGVNHQAKELSMKKKLANHELDCLIGQFAATETFEGHGLFLFSAPEYLLIAASLFHSCFPDIDPEQWRNGVDLLDFAEIPHIAHSTNGITQQLIREYFASHGKPFRIYSVINNPLTITEYVRSGIAWGRNSRFFLPPNIPEDLYCFPILAPHIRFDYYLLLNREYPLTELQNEVIDEIRSFIKKNFSNWS